MRSTWVNSTFEGVGLAHQPLNERLRSQVPPEEPPCTERDEDEHTTANGSER